MAFTNSFIRISNKVKSSIGLNVKNWSLPNLIRMMISRMGNMCSRENST